MWTPITLEEMLRKEAEKAQAEKNASLTNASSPASTVNETSSSTDEADAEDSILFIIICLHRYLVVLLSSPPRVTNNIVSAFFKWAKKSQSDRG